MKNTRSALQPSPPNTTVDVSPTDIFDIASPLGLAEPDPEEVEAGRAVAAKLIGAELALPHTYLQIRRHSGVCPLVYREAGEVTGMMALLLLNAKGHAALRDGHFNVHTPSVSHLSALGTPVSAAYGWGFAATTKDAGRAVVGATDIMQRKLFKSIDCYTRAATPDGVRVLRDKLGYVPVPWNDETGLIWIPGLP